MKYLSRFNKNLKSLREEKHLTEEDISTICQVDVSVVNAWELEKESARCYPTIANLIDVCLKTGAQLESLLDFTDGAVEEDQLELPGLAFIDENDVNLSLDQLQKEIEKLVPTEEELELLKRFRRSDDENRALILQLMS